MLTDDVQIDHHFIVRSDAKSFQLDNGRIDITSAIDGAVYTYRRALIGHDAVIARGGERMLEIKRGLVIRQAQTEFFAADRRLVARARESSSLDLAPVDGMEFKIEPLDLSRVRGRDSRFLFSDAKIQSEVCGRLEKENWLKASLEVKLPGRVPKELALFSAWWMWRQWERARALA
jgi:hypothetical protein